MFPTIAKLGPFTIHSYGLMLAIAVLVCNYLLCRDAKKVGIDSEKIVDFIFTVVIWGILGARVFYILLNLSFFIENPLEIIMIQKGGLAWQGGLIGGMLSAFMFVKRKGLDWVQILDLTAPYIALGHSIGRIGCFLNGCCFGKHLDKGLYFPVHQDYLYPTQLYDAFGLFIIFFILKFYQKKSEKPGSVFVRYLILASVLRFVVQFFRADEDPTFWGLSIFQYMALGFIGLALYVNSRLKSRS